MKIGEFSERTGLPISTLHFYERKGLLSPSRDTSGHREYNKSDLSWVAFILCLTQTGMPLTQVKQYSDYRLEGDSTLERRMQMLLEHRNDIVKEISQWEDNLKHLDEKIDYYRHAIEEKS